LPKNNTIKAVTRRANKAKNTSFLYGLKYGISADNLRILRFFFKDFWGALDMFFEKIIHFLN
jgi:hypothetical protein